MDDIDRSILEALKANSRITVSDISKQVMLSVPAVTERIRKMDESGLIEGYSIKINRAKSGYNLLAFVLVVIDRTEQIPAFRSFVMESGEVLECHHLAGEYDYLLKVLVKDTEELETFLTRTLKSVPGVIRSNTMISLSSLKENWNR
ncbi:Lrp/AsnC family transcriptional regulator [Paenibacillus sp. HN-1]|uniref:Lrp/AsnC family transcriptional regulator n=1 Tax=Paenibacillus TaxID=44249 RepID=UPI001CA885A9|nr:MULTISPECIES: Lrp/AsnC family transcriptional regulator [Paenibacillus]MBY9081761.1 Lrp/AsnC family transcriptional regulator [Paenibacillus sp. CGMCC 1.18879]MBY9083630.1 Lrp/AsnC family transcriptional regulator [Paenibacillus sinensis]